MQPRLIVVRIMVHSLNTCADTRGCTHRTKGQLRYTCVCNDNNRETVFTHESASFQSISRSTLRLTLCVMHAHPQLRNLGASVHLYACDKKWHDKYKFTN